MPDYANGKIYCVRNRADNDKIVYVGSTTQTLANRMNGHRRNAERLNSTFYTIMAQVGVSNFYIELIKDFSCERKEQLLAEEGRFIRLHRDGTLNERIAGRTWEEYYVDNREKRIASAKTYYEQHTEERKTYHKEYRNANKETLAANKKAYHEANRDEILAKKMEYREANKEKIAAQKKEWASTRKVEKAAYDKARRECKKAERANTNAITNEN